MNTPRIHPSVARMLLAMLGGTFLASASAFAQTSGTWTSTAGGNWSDITNWGGNPAASGPDAVATFSASGTQTVNLDGNETVGSLAFSTGTYTLSSTNGSVLTLATSTGTPTITGTATISATIDGTQGFSMSSGSRTLTLTGDNIYTGVTTLTNGTLNIKSSNALGASGVGNGLIVSQASGQYPQLHFSNDVTIADDITLRMNWYNTAGNGTVVGGNLLYSDSGNTTLNGAIVLDRYASSNSNVVHLMGITTGTGNLTLNGDISGAATNGQASGIYADPTRLQLRTTSALATIYVNGAISDGTLTTGGLSVYTAAGSTGIVRLNGANTYTGSTVHSAGTLLINNTTGSGTGFGSVSATSGAIFGGTGIVAPTGSNGVTFASGSIVAPGDLDANGSSIAAGKSLTFDLSSTTGSVVFASGATVSINLNAALAPSAVSESLSFIGLATGMSQVTFNNNVVNFSITGGTLADGTYTIASFNADNAFTGQLVLGSGLEAYGSAQLIETANGIELTIGSAIPEPATTGAILGALTLGFVCLLRRRRRC